MAYSPRPVPTMLTTNPVKNDTAAPRVQPSQPPTDIPMRSRIRFKTRPPGSARHSTRPPMCASPGPWQSQVDGRRYLAIACGSGKMGTPSGDTYVAFALPSQLP